MFFAEEVDNVTFGVQGSNVAETMQISSTTDDVYMRFYTNNFTDVENLYTGAVIGSSNYDKSGASKANLYFGQILSDENASTIEHTMTISDKLVEVTGDVSVYGHILPASNVAFDLGSSAYKFRDLYLSGQSIYLGETAIQETSAGRVTVINARGDQELQVDRLTTAVASSNIDIDDKNLSNVHNLRAVNIDVSGIMATDGFKTNTFGTDNPAGMNLSGITMSNIGSVDVQNITNSLGPNINVSAKSLSNITTVQTMNLTAPAAGTINVSGSTLSNITTVQTTALTGLDGKLDLSANTLSNIGSVVMNPNTTVFTDQIAPSSGTAINFLGADVMNIKDLTITGDIRARGEFFVMNTTTCNTNQFRIDNDGTGPALVANQQGVEDIIQVQDDGNTVFFIKDGGQAAFGSFGAAIDTGIPSAQVYIRNDAGCNTTGLFVDQLNAGEDILILRGPNVANGDILVVDSTGSLGIGTGTPIAKLQVVGTDNNEPALLVQTTTDAPALSVASDTGFVGIGVTDASAILEVNGGSKADPLLVFKTDAAPSAMIMNSDGTIGMGTAPVAGQTLTIAGTVNIQNLVLGAPGDTSLLTAYGMEAPAGRDFLLFGDNHLSNVTDVYADRIALEGRGTAADPVYTFRPDQNTGFFSPSEDKIAITTGGVERMHVSDVGHVGIGTTIADVRLAVYSTDAMLIPAGTSGQRPSSAKAGYVRYNSELQTFEGFGPGNEWGSLGGVKSTDQQTYITAEAAPGVNDGIIRFYNENTETARFSAEGHLGIGTTIADVSLTIEGTDAIMLPAGTSAERPTISRQGYVRYNTETLTFEGFGAGDTWGSLGGVKSVDQKTYITAESAAGVSDDTLRFVADDSLLMTLSVNSGNSNLVFHGTNTLIEGKATIADITMNARTLCNVSTLHTETITSTAAAIDFSDKALSNVDRVITQRLTGPTAAGIDAEATTLSNLNILEVAHITTAAAGGLIDVSGKSLSNVSIMEVQTIHNAASPNINVSANSLSNITTVATANVVTTVLTSTGDNINVDTKSLSNITTVETANLTSATNAINVSAKSLSNVGDIWMKQSETVYTDNISATSGAAGTIAFNNNNLTNINDLTIGGKFTVIGEFTVMETTTSNTTQFEINNEGTGPALIVNQHGANDIMKVMDDTKVVMMIKDGGNMAIGDFGTEELPAPMPDAQLYVYNNATDNQPALYVKQEFTTQHTMVLSGSGPGGSNVTFSSYGKLGFGNDAPNARIHAVHEDAVTQFMKYESITDEHAFVVGADGRVGVKADPMSGTNVNNAVTVSGTTQSDDFVAKTAVKTNKLTTDTGIVIDVDAKTLSNVALLRLSTLTTDNSTGVIDVSYKSLSNIDKLSTNTFEANAFATTNLTVDTVNTNSARGINFSASTLSNISIVDTAKLTYTLGPNINVDSKTLSNVASLSTSLLTADTAHIGVDAKSLSNVNGIDVKSLFNASGAGAGTIDFTYNVLSNVQTVNTQNLTSPNGHINVSAKTMSNVSTLDVTTVQNITTSVVNFAANTLSNVGALRTPVITSSVSQSHIDFTDTTLSNIGSIDVPRIENKDTAVIDFVNNTLSNVSVLEVDTITNAAAAHISLDTKALSNVGDIRLLASSKLEANTITTTDGRPNIDISTRTLSNITSVETQNVVTNVLTTFASGGIINVDGKTLSNVSVLEVDSIRNAAFDHVDFNYQTLSNVKSLQTDFLTTSAAGGLIDVSTKSLSNITTVELANLTTTAAGGLINVSAKTLSNVAALDTANITSATTSAVQFSAKGLSNLGDVLLNSGSKLKVDIVTTADGLTPNIDFSTRTLSNITIVETQTATLNKLTTSSATNLIDVDAKTLSNVDTIRTQVLTAELATGVIDVDASTLSNVATLELANMTTTAAGGFINVSGKSLSNITTLEVQSFANATDAHLNFSGLTLSNVTALRTTMLTTDAQNIDVDAKTLSNVAVLELATLTTTAAGGLINVDAKSLSNVTTMEVANLTSFTESINVSAKSLSNVSDLWMVPDKTIYTDRLSSTAGAGPSNVITFSGNDLGAIHDLTITGKLTVAGDFTVMETTTCNTNQLMVNNDGTGPALIVNQQGFNDIMKVTDDGKVVLFVKDGGNMGLGNFTSSNVPVTADARLYIENTVESQPAMYVQQNAAGEDTMVLVGSSDGSSNVVFSGEGKLGFGVAAPAARIDVLHGDAETQFIHYASASVANAFVVGADGRVGVNADPMAIANINNAVTVSGTTQSDDFVAKTAVHTNMLTTDTGVVIDVDAKTLSNVNMLEVMTITTTAANNTINFAHKSLSNIDFMYVDNFGAVGQTLETLEVSEISTINPSGIDMTNTTLSNIGALDTKVILSTSGVINVSGTNLSNVGVIETSTITAQTQNIDFTDRTLSNINTLDVNILTNASAAYIDVDNKTLSNIESIVTSTITAITQNIDFTDKTLSNINTLDVNILTNASAAYIDVDNKTLSNIESIVTSTITAMTQNINFTAKTLSNVDTLEVMNLTTTAAGGLINVTASTLSNVAVLELATLTTTAAGGLINVDSKTLSNVSTLEVTNLTTAAPGGLINVSGDSLSNISLVSFQTAYGTDVIAGTVTVDTMTTTNPSGIDFAANTLSNIFVVDTQKLTYSLGPNIDVDAKTLSNIGSLSTSLLTADTAHIGVDAKTLCNVLAIDVQSLTNFTGDQINISNKSLSNVSLLQTVAITSMGASHIDMTTISLSNLTNVYTSTTTTDTIVSLTGANEVDVNSDLIIAAAQKLATNTLTTTSGTVINVDTKTLSNLTNVDASTVTITTLDTRAAGANIDVAGNNLSNITVLDVATLTYSAGPNINVDAKTLSNIMTIEVANITTAEAGGLINFSDKSLSNVDSVYVNAGGVVVTDTITSVGASGLGVNFAGNDVTGIQNLTVNGDIRVQGEFFVMNTYTCNTNQFQIDNDGTGPALIVNQQGANDILHVTDDGITVFFVKDGGYAGFGEYTNGIPTSSPEGRVVIENPTAGMDTALVVRQNETTEAALEVFVAADAVAKLTVEARGTVAPVLVTDKIDAISTGGVIDVSAVTMSNMDAISVAMITHTSGVIDMDHMTLSNLGDMQTSNLKVDSIGPLTAGRAIDFTDSTLSNIGLMKIGNISSETPLGDINFNYSRILDVDTIIVRSNVTVMMQGINTFTNLPTDVVRMNPSTNKIYNTDLSSEIVRLDSLTGVINPAAMPSVDSNRKTLMHTKDRVGIGLKNPQQKLHVHGNQVITGGRLGIGTVAPRAILDIYDNNGASSTIRIEQTGTVDILDIRGAANAPIIFAAANKSVGIHTSAPSSLFALDVQGKVNAATSLRTPVIESDTGDIDFSTTNLNNILSANIQNLVVTGTIVIPENSLIVDGSAISMSNFATDLILTSVDTTNFDQTIDFNSTKLVNLSEVRSAAVRTSAITSAATTITCSAAMHVQGFDQTLLASDSLDAIYGTQIDAEIGLRVDKNILSPAFLSISDKRIKTDVVASSSEEDLDLLMKIPVTRYRFIDGDGRTVHGFIAQEVEEHAPFAVRTTTGVVPNIMRTPSAIHTEGTVIELVEHGVAKGANIKVLIDGNELMTKVKEVISPNSFRVTKPLLGETVFIYGSVVPDFKLLDSDRLVPIVFNAVKELHSQNVAMQQTLTAVLARLDALEARADQA